MSESFTAPGAQRKQLLVVGIVVAVFALAAMLCLMFLGGGKSTAGSPILGANAAAKSSAAPQNPLGVYAIPAQYAGGLGHDPFKPLVVAATGGTGGGGTSGGPGSTASPGGLSSTPPSTPTPTPTPTPTVIVLPTLTPNPTPTPTATATVTVTPSPTGLPTSSTPQTLALVSVDTAADTVTVNVTANGVTTPYTAHNGTVFGTYFKVVSILTDSTTTPATHGADFQYGDQFVQLATGQSAQLG
jgi:hypothetical protein